ncbi:MAG TPA: hypothetical protein VE667_08110 [Xanthobacteraceae bacterium]|nr:hypothetical protein [Xanthobacteraceae bacterium]
MFSRSPHSRAVSADLGDIEQRLHALERRLQAVGGRSAAGAAQAVDHVGDVIASTLSSVADVLRGRANSMGHDVAKIRGEAAKLGDRALRRLTDEVEHRPLITLAVAVAVGILVGLASYQSVGRSGRRGRPPGRRRG